MNRKKQSLRGIKKFALRIVTTALAVLPIAASTCVDSHTVENALREPVNSYEWKLQDQKYNRDVADALPPKYYFFFKQYKDDLVRFGQQYGVAPELVMGFVVEENRTRSLFQDIADVVVSLPLVYQIADPSLGVGQINLSTARTLETHFRKGHLSDQETMDALQDPVVNLEYMTMIARYIQDEHPYSQGSQNVFTSSAYLNQIGTAYVYGISSPFVSTSSLEGAKYVLDLSNIPSREILGSNHVTITAGQQDDLRAAAKSRVNAGEKEVYSMRDTIAQAWLR